MPFMDDVPCEEIPWDVSAIFTERKYLDWRSVELMMHGRDVPPPTPRTLHDVRGFQSWLDYAKSYEDILRSSKDGESASPPGGGLPVLPDDGFKYVEAFDHIVWERQKCLVLYEFDWSFMYDRARALEEYQKMRKENGGEKPPVDLGTSPYYR